MEESKKKLQTLLEERTMNDPLFMISYQKHNKNIDDCWKYIYQEARKLAKGEKCYCMTSEDVLSMAIHYYDEDDIVITENIKPVVKTTIPHSSTASTNTTSYTPPVVKKKEKHGDISLMGSLFD